MEPPPLRQRSAPPTHDSIQLIFQLSSFCSIEVGACSDQMSSGRLLLYLPHVAGGQVELDRNFPER
jgi:hypothetical protein